MHRLGKLSFWNKYFTAACSEASLGKLSLQEIPLASALGVIWEEKEK